MLINYTVCHVLEGQNRGDREKEKEWGAEEETEKRVGVVVKRGLGVL